MYAWTNSDMSMRATSISSWNVEGTLGSQNGMMTVLCLVKSSQCYGVLQYLYSFQVSYEVHPPFLLHCSSSSNSFCCKSSSGEATVEVHVGSLSSLSSSSASTTFRALIFGVVRPVHLHFLCTQMAITDEICLITSYGPLHVSCKIFASTCTCMDCGAGKAFLS